MSFHTLKYDLKKAYQQNIGSDNVNSTGFLKGVAQSFGNFGDRVSNNNHRHDEAHEIAADEEREREKANNRFKSFSAPIEKSEVKWFAGGHDYMAAVAQAIESAQYEVLIMDWWLSPELFLVRPPALNEKWRLDRTLARAAERGVDVRILCYKEVESALSLKSVHTKHALEKLHPNITVMRHPDHTALEGRNVTLFWAHHEKMLLVDRRVGFQGGIDLCFGRWDLNYHPIADMHPDSPEAVIYNGQEYNNARVQDFNGVDNPEIDSVDRRLIPRMGWQDISFQINGPGCIALERHFVERWEFLRVFKYLNRPKYVEMSMGVIEHKRRGTSKLDAVKNLGDKFGSLGFGSKKKDSNEGDATSPTYSDSYDSQGAPPPGPPPHELARYEDPSWNPDARMEFNVREEDEDRKIYLPHPDSPESACGNVTTQLCRSVSDWSHGFLTERSIQNAYVSLIRDARFSVYIENQFFIAGGQFSAQDRFHNEIGDAIVDRILQAARNNEQFKMTIVIPAIPGFAGDIKGDDAVGVRAIMNFQFKSINRGGNSILERISQAGFNPGDYIQFFHLRSYDRILPAESFGAGRQTSVSQFQQTSGYMQKLTQDYLEYERQAKQQGASSSIAACALQTTPSITEEGWAFPDINEAEHFVTEQLYIHSKLLIVDDRVVVCGSSNINDRSMAGDHDSEIAMVIEAPQDFETPVGGAPTYVAKFATTLRRHLMRKHLGLVRPQSLTDSIAGSAFTPEMSPLPVQNAYDFGSEEDRIVADPLDENLWNYTMNVARANEDVFEDVFHVYPTNKARNWTEYTAWTGEVSSTCHVTKKYLNDAAGIRTRLSEVKGHIVPMAHDFLVEEKVLVKPGIQYNDFVSDLYA